MDETEVRATIESLCAASFEPTLETTDLDMCVAATKINDADGNSPDDDAWTPTFYINRGVSKGWEIKAAKAASDFRFEEDNQSFYREQVYRACREQADRWNRQMIEVP